MPVKKGGSLIRGNDSARFASKCTPSGECIEWTGSLTENGYGKFMTGPAGGQRTWIAHRWIFAQHYNGSEPAVVRHKCDNPKCVRIEHLESGTQRDNVHDALARGRRKQTLTVDMVRGLRAVRSAGGSIRAEATRLGVNYSAAYQAAVGRTWGHVA
jgi:hypothetical protein